MIPEQALIGLGSNLGDRLSWLRQARRKIGSLPGTRILRASAVFETDPVGGPPQPAYLNACLAVETALAPHDLLAALLGIETDAGRVRTERNAPRTLDLDVLLFGGRQIADDRLVVPHPRFLQRAFALIPASEVAGSWRIPPGSETVAAAAAVVSREGVRPFSGEESWR